MYIVGLFAIAKTVYCHPAYLTHMQSSNQFSSVAQSCPTVCDPMNRSTPGLPVHYQLPEFTQNHVHQVSDSIQPSHPLSSSSPPAPNPSQHQGLFQWVNSLHEVAKVLEFQLQHQSFQWTPRTDLLYRLLFCPLHTLILLSGQYCKQHYMERNGKKLVSWIHANETNLLWL